MARTLFIIEDSTTKDLGTTILGKMLDEVKSIFSFASRFTVTMTLPANLPEKIDFTDSIVKVVAKDADVTSTQNQAQQQQLRSIEAAIKNRKLNVKMADFKRNAANPERGGVGWQAKQIIAVGGKKVAFVQTGGIASLETAVTDALTFLAPDRRTLEDAKDNRDEKLRRARRSEGKEQEEKIKEANAGFEKAKKHWALQDTAPKNWPANYQATLGLILGRLVAHEARHQYVVAHFDQGGLGGESAELAGVASSEKFHPDDQKALVGQLAKFETLQKTATLHLETFPKGQSFGF